MAKDPIDKYLEDVDKRGGTGTMAGDRKNFPTTPIKRPWFGGPSSAPKPVSKAPAGMAAAVKGDLGKYRQMEYAKVARKLGGRDVSNPLHYRTPDTAIDAKFGPGDKVC